MYQAADCHNMIEDAIERTTQSSGIVPVFKPAPDEISKYFSGDVGSTVGIMMTPALKPLKLKSRTGTPKVSLGEKKSDLTSLEPGTVGDQFENFPETTELSPDGMLQEFDTDDHYFGDEKDEFELQETEFLSSQYKELLEECENLKNSSADIEVGFIYHYSISFHFILI